MGLDISVYQKVNFVTSKDELLLLEAGVTETEIDSYYDRYVWIYVNPSFAKQADGLKTGFYTGNYVNGFRAGSYSGYGYFREKLSRLALDVEPAQVWNNPDNFVDKPFVDLINFSDCEGVIGPETSARLFRDFERHLERAKTFPKENEYDFFLNTYLSFMNAFELASKDNGVVRFH